MFSRFFIDRPIFANVIAIVTLIFGVVALYKLPVERYPQITPPTVQVSTNYPGANAEVIANTVAAPIEQQLNGVENMMYMSSTCSADGSYSLTVTFEIGTNLDTAQVLVQNRLAVAEPQLPEEVRRQGVTVRKQSTSIVLAISLTSPDGTYDGLFLSNYATLRVRDELTRVDGVGDVVIRGVGAYAMRIWIDPIRLQGKGLTTQDVLNALQRQNVQVAAGQVGQPPIPAGQNFQFTVTTLGRLSTPDQFEAIILRSGEAGQIVYLRDVARVQLGAQTYDSFSSRSGYESANLLVYQLPGSNALDVAKGVRKAMEKLKPGFPPGLEYSVPFDTTKYVDAAITEVYTTLATAGILVLVVILVFLQSWRALLVPATTVPITIIGAFAFMPVLGFSVNLLTLFGLVLAIGIVVDDAIVIVENASKHIEQGMSARDATVQAMSEVTGPVIAITLVLMAVFVPTAFLTGITGQLYRQFALTIAATALISALNALTLKPAQAATWLRRPPARRNILSRTFNMVYGWVEAGYAAIIRGVVRIWWAVLVLFVAVALLTGYFYRTLPSGFLPTEDQGYIIIGILLPDAASLERTRAVTEKLNATFKDMPGVENWFVLGGFSFIDGTAAPNGATCFVAFRDWKQRRDPSLSQDALVTKIRAITAEFQEASIVVLVPPAIQGLGVAGGFQMQVEDREGAGLSELQQRVQEIMAASREKPEIDQTLSNFRAGVPQFYLNIDREKAEKMGVLADDIFRTLQAHFGGVYVNDFNRFGRTYQVRVQAEPEYRRRPDDIYRIEVRSRRGQMVPLGTLVDVQERLGPQTIQRYNLYPAASITGQASKGTSSGQALKIMEDIAAQKLPSTMGYDWTGLAYQEKRVSNEAILIFALAVVFVYLVLAAQYESWLLPFAVILVVPLGLLGVVAAVWLRGMDNNVYVQIGIVLIIALASKNAILIVEFARELRLQGKSVLEAAVQGARMRFRPILMTSFAFILGVVPLVIATGAGAASRRALGTAVFGGMITATFLAVFFVPAFFVAMQKLSELRSGPPKARPGQVHVMADVDGQAERNGPDERPAHREQSDEGDGEKRARR
ncbi:MAG TPA: multidrug efflux RND transporter permease subunit [Gemmataceae bacterium]|nr:multidrug efflux RND transporter permease subunit [Gemmataceae bacterium]